MIFLSAIFFFISKKVWQYFFQLFDITYNQYSILYINDAGTADQGEYHIVRANPIFYLPTCKIPQIT